MLGLFITHMKQPAAL